MPPRDRIRFAAFTRNVSSWIPALVLAGTAIAIVLAGTDIQALLRYQRHSVMAMEWWRLLTGNLVHLGTAHLVLNLAGLALVSSLFSGVFSAGRWLCVLIASALSTTLGLLIFTPVEWYVGLSGLLHGAFAAGALAEVRAGRRFGYILLLLLAIKLFADLLFGASAFTTALIGGEVVVVAHFFGALGGMLGLVFRPGNAPGRR